MLYQLLESLGIAKHRTQVILVVDAAFELPVGRALSYAVPIMGAIVLLGLCCD
jgi:hypothetical protein